jgi:tRNA (guanine37-N1)-methyltransferase
MPLFAILTLFPEAIEGYLRSSILKLAQDKGLARILLVDFRDFTRDRHRTVDDRPFGGGPGMVLKPEPIAECVEWLEARHGSFRKIALCPAGTPFKQAHAQSLMAESRVLLLCGRYEGFDARIAAQLGFEEFSVGDFVLSGGELPAVAITEAAIRLIPGVLGDERSSAEDSFQSPGELDHPHYTRPRVFRGEPVPDVLLSGDHGAIDRWRAAHARARTQKQRPELARSRPPTAPASSAHPASSEHNGVARYHTAGNERRNSAQYTPRSAPPTEGASDDS